MNLWVPLGLALAGVACLAGGAAAFWRRARDAHLGELVAVDAGRPVTLRSARYRMAGRPDLLRRRPDGTVIPIELKHRPARPHGPFRSHRVQVGAYCLLVEATTGRSPPFGILRYSDREVVVRWDAVLRQEVTALLAEVTGPYDGRADPSPQKCAHCVWSTRCDASLAAPDHPRRPVRRLT